MSPTLIDPKKHHQLFLDSRALVSEKRSETPFCGRI